MANACKATDKESLLNTLLEAESEAAASINNAMFQNLPQLCSETQTTPSSILTCHIGGRSRKQKGGVFTITKVQVRILVVFALVSNLVFFYYANGLHKLDCFSPYSTLLYFFRTPIQNSYCDVIKGISVRIDLLVKGLVVGNLPALVAGATTVSLTWKKTWNIVVKCGTQIEAITTFIHSTLTGQPVPPTEAAAAAKEITDIVKSCSNITTPDPNELNDLSDTASSCSQGGAKRTKKPAKPSPKKSPPKKAPSRPAKRA